MDVAFLFWNHKKIGQHLLPLKVPHRKIEFGIVFMFLYLFIHSLIHIFEKIGQHLLPLKVRHRNIELWIELIYLNVYFDCYLFISLNLIHIKHRHDISVLKSFNNRPSMYLLPLKVPHREIEFWIVFMFIYLFIHSLIQYFFLLLFICFT